MKSREEIMNMLEARRPRRASRRVGGGCIGRGSPSLGRQIQIGDVGHVAHTVPLRAASDSALCKGGLEVAHRLASEGAVVTRARGQECRSRLRYA